MLNSIFLSWGSSGSDGLAVGKSSEGFAILLQNPIIHVIGFIAILVHEVLEQLSAVAVVRLFFKLEASAVVEVGTEFFR